MNLLRNHKGHHVSNTHGNYENSLGRLRINCTWKKMRGRHFAILSKPGKHPTLAVVLDRINKTFSNRMFTNAQ